MKTVIINGFRRGGTNLLWNMLCSIKGASTLTLHRNNRQENVEIGEYFAKKNENDFKELAKITPLLIVKGVDDDIKYNSLIKRYSNQVFEIGLLRSRFAVCESWVRRGHTLEEFIEKYNKFIDDLKANKNNLVQFNKLVASPFYALEKICQFINEPCPVNVTIMSKYIWKNEHTRGSAFNNVGDFITFPFGDLKLSTDCIDCNIDQRHEKNLSSVLRDYVGTACKDYTTEFNSSLYIL